MTCIIIDDEPLARKAIQILVGGISDLQLLDSFNSANAAVEFLADRPVDLIFLDIQMPGTNGLEFAKTIPRTTLVIFTTAYSEYALNSYEVEAIDYLIKPVHNDRFEKAVAKAKSYHKLLQADHSNNRIEDISEDYFFVKAERKTYKIFFRDIRFVEGLKDYVVIHTGSKKFITAMNIKTIHEQLPASMFVRISKSYIINVTQITSFDNNTVYIDENEIPIGNIYRSFFFEEFVAKRILGKG